MLKVLCYLLVISLVVVDIFLYLSCHVFFSSNILLIIFETNVTEIKDFAHSYLLSKYTFITLIVFVLISCVCYLLEEQRKRIACYFFQLNQRRKVVFEIVLISFLGGGVVSAWEVVALFRCNSLADIDNWEDRTANSTDLLTNVLFCSWNLKLSSEVLPKAEQSTIDISKTKHQLSWVNNLTDVILVIGEKTEIKAELPNNISVIKCGLKNNKIDLRVLLKEIYKLGIKSVFVEAGGELCGSFIKENLADKIYHFIAPKILNDNSGKSCFNGDEIEKISQSKIYRLVSVKKLGDDILITYKKG